MRASSYERRAWLMLQTPRACAHCGIDELRVLVVDHIIPLSRGGEDQPSNWQVLCHNCNFVKGPHGGYLPEPATYRTLEDGLDAIDCLWELGYFRPGPAGLRARDRAKRRLTARVWKKRRTLEEKRLLAKAPSLQEVG